MPTPIKQILNDILKRSPGIYCRCGQRLIWMKTKTGKSIPVNYHPDIEKEYIFVYSHPKMFSHFATCPLAENFRKRAHYKITERKKEDEKQ